MKVKVCGLCEEKNIEQLDSVLPDYAGFVFYEKSPRSALQVDAGLIRSINKAIRRVGVFVDADRDFILHQRDRFLLDAVQLHGNESPDFSASLLSEFKTVIKAFRVAPDFGFLKETNAYFGSCTHFLFDTAGKNPGGNGMPFNWNQLNDYTLTVPFFLSGGISMNDVERLRGMDRRWLYACDINSRFEISAGRKNMLLVQQFIQQIKTNSNVILHN